MKTIQEVNDVIAFGTWTNDQLSLMIDAVKYNRSRLGQKIKRSIAVGDNVNFTSSKTGMNVTGVVVKIAIKYVTVKTVKGLWSVPASMLTVVAEDLDPMENFNYVGSRHHY